MTERHWYFAYGSNMARARLEDRVGACLSRGHAWLHGFDLRFHKRGRDGSGKCDAFSTGVQDHTVHGVLFGMSATQRDRLHDFEGPDYAVRSVRVGHVDGEHDAFAYIARTHAIAADLAPFDWYKSYVVEGAREAGLPRAYQARVAAIPAVPDPDRSRRALNRRIIAHRERTVAFLDAENS